MKVTDEMVTRFLSWKLPKDFYPDSFITFDREKHDTWGGYPNSWPTGTNLFNAEQARGMLEHVFGLPPEVKADQPAKPLSDEEINELGFKHGLVPGGCWSEDCIAFANELIEAHMKGGASNVS